MLLAFKRKPTRSSNRCASRRQAASVTGAHLASAHWSSRFEPDAVVLGQLLCLCGGRTTPKATEGEAVHIG
jgi:hypothetical protein